MTNEEKEALIREIFTTTKFSREEAVRMVGQVERLKSCKLDYLNYLALWATRGLPQTLVHKLSDLSV